MWGTFAVICVIHNWQGIESRREDTEDATSSGQLNSVEVGTAQAETFDEVVAKCPTMCKMTSKVTVRDYCKDQTKDCLNKCDECKPYRKAKKVKSKKVKATELFVDSPPPVRQFHVPLQEDTEKILPTNEECNGDFYKYAGKLGEGTNAAVYKVYKDGEDGDQLYALKVPKTKGGRKEVIEEGDMMEAMNDCVNVMGILDKQPCFFDDSLGGQKKKKGVLYAGEGYHKFQLAAGYVSEIMDADLSVWYNENSKNFVPDDDACKKSVYDQISDGLKCIHEKGYVHNDLKNNNVYYKGIVKQGENNCPDKIKIADFGLGGAVGSTSDTFEKKFYLGCPYLPGGMFEDTNYKIVSNQRTPSGEARHEDDFLGLRYLTGAKHDWFYKRKPTIDWCSFEVMMCYGWGYCDEWDVEESLLKKCGPMDTVPRNRRHNGCVAPPDI